MEACEDSTESCGDEYPADVGAEDDSAKHVHDLVSAVIRENALMPLNYFGE